MKNQLHSVKVDSLTLNRLKQLKKETYIPITALISNAVKKTYEIEEEK